MPGLPRPIRPVLTQQSGQANNTAEPVFDRLRRGRRAALIFAAAGRGSLAILLPKCCASSRVSNFAADRRPWFIEETANYFIVQGQ